MKKITILTAFVIATCAVNSFAQTVVKKSTRTTTVVKKTTTTAAAGKVSAVTLEQGKQLLAKNDCLSCHKVDVKIVGPAYKDVAKKYPANAENYEKLTQKVIAGGSGVWGEVPMSAHPSVPPADIKKMVQYILSVK
ncbi:c-type cytochrome [Mucilaginibacter sp. UR6-11]|uniref:c-type cytochrome n=1 Tax=Mucilaginibacter sp. UR6-11 TaxID=1435644 RepID=UPI001E5A3909|nr:c-type cytochrome [Mucilaginibacter sp. UR6-11]MCC8423458.1 c-type cytochrome [Mucilaginibacter sp. UR6-11]